jgi:hypothetical protein
MNIINRVNILSFCMGAISCTPALVISSTLASFANVTTKNYSSIDPRLVDYPIRIASTIVLTSILQFGSRFLVKKATKVNAIWANTIGAGASCSSGFVAHFLISSAITKDSENMRYPSAISSIIALINSCDFFRS